MKHSIYTVLNSSYMTFGKIFIKSYFEHNVNDCNYLFVLDAGLSQNDIDWLTQFDKIQIIESNVNTIFKNGQTSPDWIKTVVAKTYGLRKIIKEYDITPILMIDSDCLVLQKLSPLINMEMDLQICYRHNHQTPLLGSYVSFNKKCLNFLDKWIETIPTINTPWKESPALSKIYKDYKDKLKIDLINEHFVSCIDKNKIDDKVKIVHFKAGSLHKTIEESIQKRIFERGFGDLVNKYLND